MLVVSNHRISYVRVPRTKSNSSFRTITQKNGSTPPSKSPAPNTGEHLNQPTISYDTVSPTTSSAITTTPSLSYVFGRWCRIQRPRCSWWSEKHSLRTHPNSSSRANTIISEMDEFEIRTCVCCMRARAQNPTCEKIHLGTHNCPLRYLPTLTALNMVPWLRAYTVHSYSSFRVEISFRLTKLGFVPLLCRRKTNSNSSERLYVLEIFVLYHYFYSVETDNTHDLAPPPLLGHDGLGWENRLAAARW
jgi:hypothetical protein